MSTTNNINCDHCNDLCKTDTIKIEDKYFCCDGCKTVYEILGDNQLFDYYNIENKPGITPNKQFSGKFSFLDSEEVLQNVLTFNDDGVAVVQFFVPSIHCSSCIWLLEQLEKLKKGVISSQVNFVKKEVKITYKTKEVNLSDIVEIMATIGYEPNINLQMLSDDDKKQNKSDSYRLGLSSNYFYGNGFPKNRILD